jgi:hypothetical protein
MTTAKRALRDHAVRDRTARSAVEYVFGPGGRRLTIADLPSPGTKRWVIRRKAEVLAAVRGGLLSVDCRAPLDLDSVLFAECRQPKALEIIAGSWCLGLYGILTSAHLGWQRSA